MKPYNDEFNPLTKEDLRRREEDEEFRRRVRNEVRRIQSGEAAEDIERDIEEEEQERQQAHEAEERERKKRSALRWMIFSGSILTSRHVAGNYRYLVIIAFLSLISIMVMFWSLYTDSRYSRMERDVQLLREDSTGRVVTHHLDLTQADITASPFYYLQQNDIIYVKPTKSKVYSNTFDSNASMWTSLVSIALSILSTCIIVYY